MSPILSRQAIALQADAAAKNWTAAWLQDPAAPKPANPHNEHIEPDHFRCWECDFQRALLEHSALPETEGSA
jgi:hypothetical protein